MKRVREKQAAPLPFVGNALELAKLMDKLRAEKPRGRWNDVRASESDYQSGDFTVSKGRRKVARTTGRALQSAFFFLYCRVYYRTSVGYRGRRSGN